MGNHPELSGNRDSNTAYWMVGGKMGATQYTDLVHSWVHSNHLYVRNNKLTRTTIAIPDWAGRLWCPLSTHCSGSYPQHLQGT